MAKTKTARVSRGIVPGFVMDNIFNLATERMHRGLSRKDLAEMSGIPMARITGYETGSIAVARISYNKIARVFEWQEWD